jgi:hypothetical protein
MVRRHLGLNPGVQTDNRLTLYIATLRGTEQLTARYNGRRSHGWGLTKRVGPVISRNELEALTYTRTGP